MKTRRLAAFAAAASLAAVAFVSTAAPASAWDLRQCKATWAKGEDHPHCDKFKTTTTAKPTTTKAPATTVKPTTTKAPTTTVVVKPETKPAPVKVTPKYTG